MTAKVDVSELLKFQDKLRRAADGEVRNAFYEDCIKEIAARFLRKTIKRTPVVSGNLRRGWRGYLRGKLRIKRIGNMHHIRMANAAEYASYVEYGHRTPGGKGWVKGQFPMTISAREVEDMAPALLRLKIKKYIEGVLNGQ
mgnify:FL=1